MLRKHMAACLLATAFVAPTLAQVSVSPSGSSGGSDRPTATGSGSTATGSPAMQPTGSNSAMSPGAANPSAMGTSGSGNPPPNAMGQPSGNSPSMTSSSGPMGGESAGAPNTMSTSGNGTAAASGGMQTDSTGRSPATSPTEQASTQSGPNSAFMTHMMGDQLMASKLIGTSVVSAEREAIGDVNDVILDHSGRAMAVVVGVGGFLGIGEKNVAVPFTALDLVTRDQANAMTSSNNAGSTQTGSNPSSLAANAPNRNDVGTTGSTSSTPNNRQTATTGNTGYNGQGLAKTSTASTNHEGGVPDRLVLRMTKADLERAPAFQPANRNNATGATGSSGTNANANRQ